MPKRLTVGDIQIHFDGERAVSSCRRGLDLAALKTELEAACVFIERWLDAAEPPRPRKPTPEEIEMETVLSWAVRKLKAQFDSESIAAVIRVIAEKRWPDMAADRRDLILKDLICKL